MVHTSTLPHIPGAYRAGNVLSTGIGEIKRLLDFGHFVDFAESGCYNEAMERTQTH